MRFQAPESLSEQIAQHIGLRIIKAELKPKERIQELKVAKELDVSRGSVREALLILERRHLVNIFPRKGAVVSELSAHHVNCLYDMYITLLSMLLSTFSQCWKDGDLEEMIEKVESINKLMSSPEKPVDKIVEAGFELMSMTYEVVNNPYLEETLENFKPGISRTYYLAMKPRQEELHQTRAFFNKLVSAVLKRDQEAVKVIVADYGEFQRTLTLQELKSATSTSNSYI
ncbi:GntR family transcriptional regulator [Alkalimarinus coralli]|uniref:GntR family transcriptional regulator n=1 Tax=Alkalimarinus coralli TaxID=2935863 RepID=UPI00202B2F30|nr:GntR family transcriptional regulator [Alkalimarinus coralli]